MSEENVILARKLFEAFNDGGRGAMEDLFDPEVVWQTDPLVPEPGVYEGRDRVVAYLEGYLRAFGSFRFEVHEVIELGPNELLAVTTALGRPLNQPGGDTQFFNWCLIGSV